MGIICELMHICFIMQLDKKDTKEDPKAKKEKSKEADSKPGIV